MSRNELDALVKFVEKNSLCFNGEFVYPRSVSNPDFSFREPIALDGKHFRFIESPVNPNGTELLLTPDFLNQYFAKNGFNVVSPIPLLNKNGTTLFICAGVQFLDPAIHRELEIPKEPIFVAQPVLRTQFIDCIGEGSSTSFINASTCQLNISSQEHFHHLQTWINLFVQLGLRETDLYFKTESCEQQWGGKTVNSEKIFIIYDGLEIGDASYVEDLPQKGRPNLSLSDIGFGLERIKWIMQGGSYFDVLGNGRIANNIDGTSAVCSHTLSLLAGEGLKPSNKEQGYRFRLFSKKLVSNILGGHLATQEQSRSYYNYWKKWIKLSSSEDQSLLAITQENTRNFNRILLDKLCEKYPDVGLDINLSTAVILKRLKGTSVKSDYLTQVLNELKYENE